MVARDPKQTKEKKPRAQKSAAPLHTKLGRSQEPLYRFFDRLGLKMYGLGWSISSRLQVSKLANDIHPVGSNEDKIAVVYDSIIGSLQSGDLTAIVNITVSVTKEVRELALTDDLVFDDEDLVYDDGSLKSRKFSIHRGFWNDHAPDIKVHSATVAIEPEFLVERVTGGKRVRAAIKVYGGSLPKRAEVLIENPDYALSTLVVGGEIPTAINHERFVVYESKCRLESLAVGWRYIALYGDSQELKATEVGRHMMNYMNEHDTTLGDDPSPDRLKACQRMASNMLRQLKDRASSVSVLASSKGVEKG